MPVRSRAGSSPVNGQSTNHADRPASPARVSMEEKVSKGSFGAVEVVKQRERRDTTTSSDMSSENELDASLFQRRQLKPSRPIKRISFLDDQTPDEAEEPEKRLADVEEENEQLDQVSDTSSLSSEFAETADSESLLDVDDERLASSSLADLMPGPLNVTPASPRKTRHQAPNQLQALPPPRPISMIQPASALGQAIRAQKSKPKNPLEIFAKFSGKGALDPLNIRIYAPSSETNKPFELPLQKAVKDADTGALFNVTVADTIGLCLWRYQEEGLKPPIPLDKQDVNRWTLRMVDDGEVDDEFPALNRVSNITDFTSNNNRPARGRSRGKSYDEFALVEATETQYQENKRITPKYTKQFVDFLTVPVDPPAAPALQNASESAIADDLPFNGIINKPFAFASRKGSATLDAPALPTVHSTPRMGPQKMLKIHFTTLEAQSQNTTVEVTTDTYLAEVLDMVCKRWNLDKAHHFFKVSGTNVMAPSDRTVETLGSRNDLDLVRRRFANAGAHGLGSSPSSSSPNAPLILNTNIPVTKKTKKSGLASSSTSGGMALHPLSHREDAWASTSNYKRYNVMRKNPMSFTPSQARTLLIDGEYLHILPGDAGKNIFDTGNATNAKTAMVPFSMIVGCKVSRRHPKSFRVVVFRDRETKRYDFESPTAEEAAEIVGEIRKGMEPFFSTGFDMGG
jgi:target of rapamycin complex 2 subunit MAPKAP1